jgi:hypothetical protein
MVFTTEYARYYVAEESQCADATIDYNQFHFLTRRTPRLCYGSHNFSKERGIESWTIFMGHQNFSH